MLFSSVFDGRVLFFVLIGGLITPKWYRIFVRAVFKAPCTWYTRSKPERTGQLPFFILTFFRVLLYIKRVWYGDCQWNSDLVPFKKVCACCGCTVLSYSFHWWWGWLCATGAISSGVLQSEQTSSTSNSKSAFQVLYTSCVSQFVSSTINYWGMKSILKETVGVVQTLLLQQHTNLFLVLMTWDQMLHYCHKFYQLHTCPTQVSCSFWPLQTLLNHFYWSSSALFFFWQHSG